MDRQTTWHNRSLRSSRGKKSAGMGVLEDWPRPRVHLEDKLLWPWPWPRPCCPRTHPCCIRHFCTRHATSIRAWYMWESSQITIKERQCCRRRAEARELLCLR